MRNSAVVQTCRYSLLGHQVMMPPEPADQDEVCLLVGLGAIRGKHLVLSVGVLEQVGQVGIAWAAAYLLHVLV